MQIIEKQQSFSQSLIWQFQHDISSEVHYLLGWSFKFQASALKKREKTSGVTDAPQLAFPTWVTATLLPNGRGVKPSYQLNVSSLGRTFLCKVQVARVQGSRGGRQQSRHEPGGVVRMRICTATILRLRSPAAGLGSTSLTTDDTAAVIAESRHLPYGQVRWNNGASVTDFGFTSQRKDGFGLMDYNARFYSPYWAGLCRPIAWRSEASSGADAGLVNAIRI